MSEKVIFEFRASNDKDGTKYEIRQGEEIYTCSEQKIARCLPLAFFSRPKSLVRMHRGFIHHAQKRARERLNALESMYADFYGSGKTTTGSDNHG